MAHNSRVRGSSDAWANIQPSEAQALDANIAAGVNGVEGSTHSPPAGSPIDITGSGLQNTGPLAVQRGGLATLTAAGAIVLDGGWNPWSAGVEHLEGDIAVPTTLNGRRYLCTTPGTSGVAQPTWPTAYAATVQDGAVVWTCIGPDGDVPQYSATHAGRTPTVVHSLASGQAVVPGTWRVRNVDGMVQAIAPMMDISDGNGPQPARWVVPIRMHDTGTVSSVSVSLRVGWPHTSLPNVMPGARLLRLPTSGIPQPMTSLAAGADVNGYLYLPKPASAAAWRGQQTLTFTCDQNNLVDIANYTYVLELIEEQWTGGPNYPWSLVMTQPVGCATTASSQFDGGAFSVSVIDGVNLGIDTPRVLVKDGAYAFLSAAPNGIWIPTNAPSSGAAARSLDLTSPSSFSQGMIVPVTGGAANGGSYWQAQTSIASWDGGVNVNLTFLARGPDDDETPFNAGTQFFGHGCIWGAAAISYTGITQQDFQ